MGKIEAICFKLPRYGYRISLMFAYARTLSTWQPFLDAYSRKMIGCTVSVDLDTFLTLVVLKMAIAQRRSGSHHPSVGSGSAVCLK